jgi:hypothetical protein
MSNSVYGMSPLSGGRETTYVRLCCGADFHEGWIAGRPQVGAPFRVAMQLFYGKLAYRDVIRFEVYKVGRDWFLSDCGIVGVTRVPPPAIIILKAGTRLNTPMYVRMVESEITREGWIWRVPSVGAPLRMQVIVERGNILSKPVWYETQKINAAQEIWYTAPDCRLFAIVKVPPLSPEPNFQR